MRRSLPSRRRPVPASLCHPDHLNLLGQGESPGPVRLVEPREAVDQGRRVHRTAGVAVPGPGAPHPLPLLQDQEARQSSSQKLLGHRDAGDAGTDNDDVHSSILGLPPRYEEVEQGEEEEAGQQQGEHGQALPQLPLSVTPVSSVTPALSCKLSPTLWWPVRTKYILFHLPVFQVRVMQRTMTTSLSQVFRHQHLTPAQLDTTSAGLEDKLNAKRSRI